MQKITIKSYVKSLRPDGTYLYKGTVGIAEKAYEKRMKYFIALHVILSVYQTVFNEETRKIQLFLDAIIPKNHESGKINVEYEFRRSNSEVIGDENNKPDCQKKFFETSTSYVIDEIKSKPDGKKDNLEETTADIIGDENNKPDGQKKFFETSTFYVIDEIKSKPDGKKENLEETTADNNLFQNLVTAGITEPQTPSILTRYRGCDDIPRSKGSGVYTILLDGVPMFVYCDIENDGYKYMVIQRRLNGQLSFYRNWTDYEQGFGDPAEEYWIGNEALSQLSSRNQYKLKIELKSFDNVEVYAEYDSFSLSNSDTKYTLHVSGYSGTAGDSLTSHNGRKFSTYDQDNDSHDDSCAQMYKGAWWYGQCHTSNLNGFYYNGTHNTNADGINWYAFRGHHESMKTVVMKIRRVYSLKLIRT